MLLHSHRQAPTLFDYTSALKKASRLKNQFDKQITQNQ